MRTKYFNQFEFKDAIGFIDKNPSLAKIKFEEYLKKYPKDYSTYPYYISCLITLVYFDNTKRLVNHLKKVKYINDSFKHQQRKIKILENNIVFCYCRLLSYKNKFEELYEFCKDNLDTIIDLKITILLLYCKSKLNILDEKLKDENKYLYGQIIEYKEDNFFEHIKEHFADYNKDLDNPNSSIFSVDFPIDSIIETVKSHIPSDKRLFTGFFQDTYVFKYDYCGRVDNKTTNYFKVICFNNTKNIITMFPCSNCEELPCIDLNYINQNKNNENTKVKRLSQIDKFNQRYKL